MRKQLIIAASLAAASVVHAQTPKIGKWTITTLDSKVHWNPLLSSLRDRNGTIDMLWQMQKVDGSMHERIRYQVDGCSAGMGEIYSVDFDGKWFQLVGARQRPTPLDRIPIVVGGTGRRSLALVAEHADWWNVPVHQLDRLDEKREELEQQLASAPLIDNPISDAERLTAVRAEIN